MEIVVLFLHTEGSGQAGSGPEGLHFQTRDEFQELNHFEIPSARR
jgi:hypothetical protein